MPKKPSLKTTVSNLYQPPGLIRDCVLPQDDNIHLIAMAALAKQVSPFYDSLIAQIICYGQDRNDTIAKLRAYLDRVRITGVCTNIPCSNAC